MLEKIAEETLGGLLKSALELGATAAENIFDRVTHIVVYRMAGDNLSNDDILNRYYTNIFASIPGLMILGILYFSCTTVP